jgi:hypothetical protein
MAQHLSLKEQRAGLLKEAACLDAEALDLEQRAEAKASAMNARGPESFRRS